MTTLSCSTAAKQRLNLSTERKRRQFTDEPTPNGSLSTAVSDEAKQPKKRSNFSDAPSASATEAEPAPQLPPDINPLTLKKYSDRYYDILEHRKRLPAWEARKNFVKLVKKNQVGFDRCVAACEASLL